VKNWQTFLIFSFGNEGEIIGKVNVLYFKYNMDGQMYMSCTKKRDDFCPSFLIFELFFCGNIKNAG